MSAERARGSFEEIFFEGSNFRSLWRPGSGELRQARPPTACPTQKNHNNISMLLKFCWTNEPVARALRITPPSPRKHYSSELRYREEARDRLDTSLAGQLWRQVEAGNVSALREFRDLLEHNDLMLFGGSRREPDRRPPKLGKKEEALLAARQPDLTTPLARLLAEDFGSLN